MKRKTSLLRSLIVTAVVFIFMAVSAVPAFAESAVGLKVTVNYRQSEARKQFDMINSARTGGSGWYWNSDNSTKTYCGKLPALTYDYQLEELAMKRAMELAVLYSHVRPDGTGLRELNEGCTWYGIAENIAYGFGGGMETAGTVYNLFMEESSGYSGQGHRRNILSTSYTSCAIACVEYGGRYFWVQEFRNPNNDGSYRTPNDSQASGVVNVLESKIGSFSVEFDGADITLDVGGSADLPAARLMAEVPDTHAADKMFEVNAAVSAASDNTRVVRVEGSKIIAVGSGSAKIVFTALTGGKAYSRSLNVKVRSLDLSEANVRILAGGYVYDGSAKAPPVSVVLDGRTLVNGSDYDVSYANNISAGVAAVIVSGKGVYSGQTIRANYIIAPRPITDSDVVVSGGTVTVYDGSQVISDDQYSVQTTDAGSGLKKVTVTGKGNYTGSVEKYFSAESDTSKSGISGKVTTKSGGKTVDLTDVKVTLKGTDGVTYQAAVSGNTYYADVPSGSYKLTISKGGYASRSYSIDISSGVTFDVSVSLLGDLNYDGSVDISDVSMLINQVNGIASLSDYAFTAADTDHDGKVTITDAVMIINQINGISRLY